MKVFDALKVQIGNMRQMRKCTCKLAALEQKGKITHTVVCMPLVAFTVTITGVWLSSDFTVLILQGLQDRETLSPHLVRKEAQTQKLAATGLSEFPFIPAHKRAWSAQVLQWREPLKAQHTCCYFAIPIRTFWWLFFLGALMNFNDTKTHFKYTLNSALSNLSLISQDPVKKPVKSCVLLTPGQPWSFPVKSCPSWAGVAA